MQCTQCGGSSNVIRHHTSYKPPEVIPLCRRCHAKEHRRLDDLSELPEQTTFGVGSIIHRQKDSDGTLWLDVLTDKSVARITAGEYNEWCWDYNDQVDEVNSSGFQVNLSRI